MRVLVFVRWDGDRTVQYTNKTTIGHSLHFWIYYTRCLEILFTSDISWLFEKTENWYRKTTFTVEHLLTFLHGGPKAINPNNLFFQMTHLHILDISISALFIFLFLTMCRSLTLRRCQLIGVFLISNKYLL